MIYITIYNKDGVLSEMVQGQPQASTGSKYFFFFLQDDICFILQGFVNLLPEMVSEALDFLYISASMALY